MRLVLAIFLLALFKPCPAQTSKRMDYFDENGEVFLKLYKKTGAGYQYFEAWNTTDKAAVIHWGQLGTKGESRQLNTQTNDELRAKLTLVIDKMISDGYAEVPFEQQFTVAITFKLKSWGTIQDLDRREEVRSILTEHLGWTGNGKCDDADIGSGEMTLYADVIEPYVAAKTIKEELELKNVNEPYEFTIMQGDSVLHSNYRVK